MTATAERTTEEAIAAFRTKYPQRVAALNAILAPCLGIHARTKLSAEAVAETCRPIVDAVIAAAWGLEV